MDVAEALLHVRNGYWFLCLLVANVPDSFNEGTVIARTTLHMLSADDVKSSASLIVRTSFIWLVSELAGAEIRLYLTSPKKISMIASL